uniref:Uncharacterized protein n=1 Tax=Pseudomonas phage HRDY3 TaxID=3236930 RepID=A0AB39CDH9_9VIRU
MSILKFPGVFFLELVPTLFGASEWKTDKPFQVFDTGTGLYTFNFGDSEHKSDSAEELIEIAIREIEKQISKRLAEIDSVYVVVQLACGPDGPDIDTCDAFNVLERPYRVELYTDTFRRGVAKLRKLKEAV